MKNFKLFAFAILIVVPFNGQSQILKKMKQKAENAVERTVLNRTDREAAKTTDQGLDAVLVGDNDKKNNDKSGKETANPNEEGQNAIGGIFGQGGGQSTANVADSYQFSYKAKMKITTNKDEMFIDYLLQPDVSYFGSAYNVDGTQSVSVMDLENIMMVIFMEQQGQKMMTAFKVDKATMEQYSESTKDAENDYLTNLKEIGGKTILGYKCKGYETTTEDGTYRMWITSETPVGFWGAGMGNEKFEMPDSIMKIGKNAMVMEMEFLPAKNKNESFHMICTDFGKENKTIYKKDYQSMGF